MKQLIFAFIGLLFLFTACAGNAVPSGDQNNGGTNESEQVSQGTEGETLEEEEALNTQEPVSKQEVPFVPQTDPPTGLAPELEEQIKRDYCDSYNRRMLEKGWKVLEENDVNRIIINAVYGEYHGCVALKIKIASQLFADEFREVEIGGYTFVYGSGQSITVWSEGEFYSLKNAYEQEILTESDIGGIYASYTSR